MMTDLRDRVSAEAWELGICQIKMARELSCKEAKMWRGVMSQECGVDDSMEIDAIEEQSPRSMDPCNLGSTSA